MFYIGLARETTLNLIQENVDLTIISKYTGLSLEELNALKEKIE